MNAPGKLLSLFDVLGPVMIGPSSSATAGACRIGRVGRMLLGAEPERALVCFTERFGCKYSGNRAHAAVIAGLLGYAVDAPELREAEEIAQRRGLAVEVRIIPDPPPVGDGPQPIVIKITIARGERELTYTGFSVGGGEIRIADVDGMPTELTGTETAVAVFGDSGLETRLAAVPGFSGEWQRGDGIYLLQLDAPPAPESLAALERLPGVRWVGALASLLDYELKDAAPLFTSIGGMADWCAAAGRHLADAALAFEKKRSGLSAEETLARGRAVWKVMRDAADKGLAGGNAVLGGLADGSGGRKLARRVKEGRAFCGETAGLAAAMALSCMEYNACMGCVVAAPTAGACGVLPGALAAAAAKLNAPEEKIVEALLAGALIGVVIAGRVPVSGTMGGCQAEVGVASALAAAALVHLDGGDAGQCAHAVAIALKNVLGLVCDPVAGAVEVPCVKRNAMGVVNAMIAADMARAGVTSAIPADDAVTALAAVAAELPPSLRNSGHGGLCASPAGQRLTEERYAELARRAGRE